MSLETHSILPRTLGIGGTFQRTSNTEFVLSAHRHHCSFFPNCLCRVLLSGVTCCSLIGLLITGGADVSLLLGFVQCSYAQSFSHIYDKFIL